MKLGKLIKTLQKAEDQLGASEEIRIEIHCNGVADYVDVLSVSSSKFTGLSMEIEPPYFARKEYNQWRSK